GLGNDLAGIIIAGRPNNQIGGTSAGEGNLIASNGLEGIDLNGAKFTIVEGNTITANTTNGITIRALNGSIPATDNVIGGITTGAGNIISDNGGHGIRIGIETPAFNANVNNSILTNSITNNGDLAIDLEGVGVTANDAGDGDGGANDQQNFPVLLTAETTGASSTIIGSLNSVSNGDYLIQFFANSSLDTSGNGEGATFIGSTVVSTDAAGDAPITLNLPFALTDGDFITATATELDGVGNARSTSEFSEGVPVIESNTAATVVIGGPYAVDEGGSVALDASSTTDAQQNTGSLLFEWDLDGDGNFGETGTAASHGDELGINPIFDATAIDGPDTLTIDLRVTDDGGLTSTASTTVTINNVAPGNLTLDPVAPIDEGGTATLTGSFTDPGAADTHTVTINWG
ncbi:MAG: hypothetical protein MI741_23535, partial [Rhodospirillales bacterium]|nr:hypothetical protein [Rhodospirillales bacterium]